MSRLIRGKVKAERKAAPVGSLQSHRPAHRALTARALAPATYSDLLGKPYVDGGRGPDNYDCVGLVIEIAKRLGKQMPDYLSSETELHAQLGAGGKSLADCPQIAQPEPGCVVLLRISPTQHHLAFMVDEFRMIHTLKGTGCVIERVMSQLWQRKVIGFYSLTA